MDATKLTALKTSIAAAKTAVKALSDSEVAARSYNALRSLGGVETALTKAEAKLETAIKRSAPRAKKASKKKKGNAVAAEK
jgi:hypothetical protein